MSSTKHTEGENAPLLGNQESSSDDATTTKTGDDSGLPQQEEPQHPTSHQRWWSKFSLPIPITSIKPATLLPLLGSITVFLNECEFHIKGPAQLRATEALACIEYYEQIGNKSIASLGRSIPELMCKVPSIQERVAAIHGTFYVVRMISALMGTLLLLHWFRAGRRRPVLILHKVNIVASNLLLFLAYFGYPQVPIWFLTLTGITGVIGGNFDLGTSTLYAAYTDVIPDPTYRGSLIFVTTSLQYASQAISLPLTGHLMNLNGRGNTPEVSFYVALSCSVTILFVMILFFPETFNPSQNEELASSGVIESSNTESSIRRGSRHESLDSTSKLENPYHVLREAFGMPRVIALLIATLGGIASSRMIDWYGLMQYPSIKLSWTVSKTTLLICMQAILSFFVFIAVLPLINRVCRKFGISGRRINAGIVVVSSVIVLISAMVFGLPDVTPQTFIAMTAFYTLGSGVSTAIQAYTVSIAPTPQVSGAALTVISLAATAGKVVASAIWPIALSIGLEHPSHKLSGLPFFVVAALLVFVIIAMCLAEGYNRSSDDDDDDDQHSIR